LGIPGTATPSGFAIVNTDGDTRPDYLDIDSDNDGISDLREGGGNDFAGTGIAGTPGVSDALGFPLVSGPLNPSDVDLDGKPNFQDTDSDSDGVFDIKENPLTVALDANDDGKIDITTDADNDGAMDVFNVDTNPSFGGSFGQQRYR
jgi:clumping factor A